MRVRIASDAVTVAFWLNTRLARKGGALVSLPPFFTPVRPRPRPLYSGLNWSKSKDFAAPVSVSLRSASSITLGMFEVWLSQRRRPALVIFSGSSPSSSWRPNSFHNTVSRVDLPAPASPVTSRKGKLWNSARICSANREPNQKARATTPLVPKQVHSQSSHSAR
ncbi:hypothetical protein D9M71_549720 [compost metagenome]